MNRKNKINNLFFKFKRKIVSLIGLFIKTYQYSLSPFLGENCRHYPSCSNYSLESFNKHGLLKGMLLSFFRLLRCNPWGLGGFDPVPENVSFKNISSFKFVGNYQTKLYHQNTHGQD